MEIKNRLWILALVMFAVVFASVSIKPSPASSEQLMPNATLMNVALQKTYTLNIPPNYPPTTDPDDAIQLTDGEYAEELLWADKLTAGWKGEPDKMVVAITIDLGYAQSIRGASFSTAALESSGVYWPAAINVSISDDGKTFRELGDLVKLSAAKGTPPDPKTGYSKYRFWTDEMKGKGRFVRLQVKATGEYIFVDEIEIYKGK